MPWFHTARLDGGAWGFSFVVASCILIIQVSKSGFDTSTLRVQMHLDLP
jgi:hypothetical protein